MADKTTGKLKLWLAKITDKISDTINIYLSENFYKIDDEFSSLKDGVDEHKAKNVTQGDTPHGMGKIAAQDYEEGVWTPTLKGSEEFNENTYGARMGWYVKKGNEVTVYMRMSVPSVDSTMQGAVHIYGLPFVSRANTRSSAGTFYGGRLKWKATWKQIGAGQLGDTDYVRLFAVLDNAEQDDLTAGDFTNGFFLNLSLSYLV